MMAINQHPINFDRLAIGVVFILDGERYRKVASLLSEHMGTGRLLYDARLFPGWENAEPPQVFCPSLPNAHHHPQSKTNRRGKTIEVRHGI